MKTVSWLKRSIRYMIFMARSKEMMKKRCHKAWGWIDQLCRCLWKKIFGAGIVLINENRVPEKRQGICEKHRLQYWYAKLILPYTMISGSIMMPRAITRRADHWNWKEKIGYQFRSFAKLGWWCQNAWYQKWVTDPDNGQTGDKIVYTKYNRQNCTFRYDCVWYCDYWLRETFTGIRYHAISWPI